MRVFSIGQDILKKKGIIFQEGYVLKKLQNVVFKNDLLPFPPLNKLLLQLQHSLLFHSKTLGSICIHCNSQFVYLN